LRGRCDEVLSGAGDGPRAYGRPFGGPMAAPGPGAACVRVQILGLGIIEQGSTRGPAAASTRPCRSGAGCSARSAPPARHRVGPEPTPDQPRTAETGLPPDRFLPGAGAGILAHPAGTEITPTAPQRQRLSRGYWGELPFSTFLLVKQAPRWPAPPPRPDSLLRVVLQRRSTEDRHHGRDSGVGSMSCRAQQNPTTRDDGKSAGPAADRRSGRARRLPDHLGEAVVSGGRTSCLAAGRPSRGAGPFTRAGDGLRFRVPAPGSPGTRAVWARPSKHQICRMLHFILCLYCRRLAARVANRAR